MNKDIIEFNFSKNAETYDDNAVVQKECASRLAEMLGEEGFPRILEIGCGTGEYTRCLADRYRNAEITAVDISETMLNVARKKLGDRNIRFVVGDAEDIEIDGKYDLITSNASFQWFDNVERAVKVFSGALNKSGVLCFSMYGRETFREFKRALDIYYGPHKWLTSSRFVSFEGLESMLNRHFKSPYLEEKFFTVRFPSLINFLRSVKQSGARGEGLDNDIYLGRYGLKGIEEKFAREFGGIIATHHVYFCKAGL
jgi:malonyl-CoA O-methyltransferase